MFSRFWRASPTKKYFDYASITPLDYRVVKAVQKVEKRHWQNPSALYDSGVRAGKLLASAREGVARVLSGTSIHSAHADEIVFTSGGTESDNVAIQGVVKAWKKDNPTVSELPHIVISAIEHPAVKKTVEDLEHSGLITVSYISVDEQGLICEKELKEVFQKEKNIILVSVMLVNNEIGTIQPIAHVASLIRKYRKDHGSVYPYLHTDACQAPCYLDMQIDKLGVDLLSLDGGKIYGPRGVGCLYIKRGVRIEKISQGGAQESDIRPGTENLPAIVGFAKALEICTKEKEKENIRLRKLQEYIINNLPEGVTVNGSVDVEKRISNNINICIPDKDSEFVLFQLDVQGFEVSTGTTCQNKQEESRSYVVDALGHNCGASSLRISFGRFTKFGEVKSLIKVLKK